MSAASIVAIAVCAAGLAGCQTSGKVDRPVVGPRPPRVSDEILTQLEASDPAGNVRTASASGSTSGDILQVLATQEVLRDEDLAARVNGHPIFISEVLEPYQSGLAKSRSQMTPQAYQQARRQILEKDLENYIEQALVLTAVRKKFKSDQWSELQSRLDEFFYEEAIPDLQEKFKVGSAQEVEAILQEHGTTLAAYRRTWGDQQLSQQWVREQLPDASISRPELLAEYQRRIEDYREPAQVKWQQCWISNVGSGGAEGARNRMRQAISDLQGGASFDDVIAKHCDGPLAKSGGHWDWADPESLADERLKQTLQQLELNQIGPVLEDSRGCQLVKLTGRKDAKVRPFEEVQAELRESLKQKKRETAAKELIKKLRAEAHIETIFDRQQHGS